PQLLRTNVERRRIRLDACTQRLGTALKTYRETQLNRVTRARDRVTALVERADRAIEIYIANRDARLERSYQLLRAFSYQSVLSRGFALVRDQEGHPLRSAAAVTAGARLDIEFADGRVGAVAEGARPLERALPASPLKRPAWKPRKPKTSSG